MKDNKYLNENEKGDVTMNNENEINSKEIYGVEYVNTTHEDYVMSYVKDAALRPFDVTGQKVNEYTRSLTPHPDCFKQHVDEKDRGKKYGAIYYFPHYIIKSDTRIEPDVMDADMVDITHICDYPDDIIVLIDKKDMSCKGFNRYILDTKSDMLICLNKLKIKFSEDPERFTAYRQMVTMVKFINKYNKYIHLLPDNDVKWVLVHTLNYIDNGDEKKYREYRIVTLNIPSNVTTDIRIKNPSVLNNNAENPLIKDDVCNTERFKAFVNKSNDERKYCSLQYIEDVIDMIENDDELDKEIIIKLWKIVLKNLIRAFNRKRKEDWNIENIWESNYGKALNMFIEFICNNNKFVKELTGKYARFSIKVNDNRTLNLTIKYERGEELDYMLRTSRKIYNPGDEITVSHQD